MSPRVRVVAGMVATVLAGPVVWAVLTVPDRPDQLTPGAFARPPLEAVVLGVVVLLLPGRTRTLVTALAGALLGAVLVLRLLDLAFWSSLDRPFDVVLDWEYVGSVVGLVRDSFGPTTGSVLLVVGGGVLLTALVLVPLATVRLGRILAEHRRPAARTLAVLGLGWLLLAVTGVQPGGFAAAGSGVAAYAWGEVQRVPTELRDQQVFERATRDAAETPLPAQLRGQLGGLRGKDVLLVFVESYGRVAVEGSSVAPGVRHVLDAGTRRLATNGFGARSAFLTSPTFGGISWLAHATLQSGLWVDSQQRYDTLVSSHRSTLSRTFAGAGWRTVSDVPADTQAWPQGRFFGYEHFYDSRNVGYAGPPFGYPTMPDQFTLEALHRLELAPVRRRPVMAEIDLVSSHTPWSRTPRLLDPGTRGTDALGDGSVYDGMPATLPSAADVWTSPQRVRAAYATAVEYSLSSLISFVEHDATARTVLVVLGDHQPATVVSGLGASHDVPVSVIARDPAVLRRIDAWGWQPGLRPSPTAPVWRMDSFRDRFLSAYAR